MTKDLMFDFGCSHSIVAVAAEDSHYSIVAAAEDSSADLVVLALIVDADLDLDVRKYFHSGLLLD
jgi:hypothetical protein